MIATVNGIRIHTPTCPLCGGDTAVHEYDDGYVYRCMQCRYELTYDDVLTYEEKEKARA